MCESGDWLGRDRSLGVQPGDLLAVHVGGRLRLRHEFELQHPSACRRSDGRRQQGPPGARARTDRRPVPRRAPVLQD
ncbi:hypothetical protein ACTMU2_34560 [Cupriavidus basilensis]